jgi:hypothetical protein
MDYNSPGSGDVNALTITTGAVVVSAPATGCTLAATTYYFPVGGTLAPTPSQTSIVAVHMKWDANVVATAITVETCNFPQLVGGGVTGPTDVTDFDSTAGNWVKEDPSSAYVATVGAGVTVANATVSTTGGAIGAASWQIGNLGSRRVRMKIVLTTGGVVRCSVHGKQGS